MLTDKPSRFTTRRLFALQQCLPCAASETANYGARPLLHGAGAPRRQQHGHRRENKERIGGALCVLTTRAGGQVQKSLPTCKAGRQAPGRMPPGGNALSRHATKQWHAHPWRICSQRPLLSRRVRNGSGCCTRWMSSALPAARQARDGNNSGTYHRPARARRRSTQPAGSCCCRRSVDRAVHAGRLLLKQQGRFSRGVP